MNDSLSPTRVPPFPRGYRASGVALDIATLPSRYGIGDLGPGAIRWVDRLHEMSQSWWHAVDWGSSRYCDSVWESSSSFAGNELLISPDWLIEDGLLTRGDCECVRFPAGSIEYDVVVPFQYRLLEKAWMKFNAGSSKDMRHSYEQFRTRQAHWLEDYALFRALKAKYRGAHYHEWEPELVRREPSALARARRELVSQVGKSRFAQFVLFRQIQRLKDYARKKGVSFDDIVHICKLPNRQTVLRLYYANTADKNI